MAVETNLDIRVRALIAGIEDLRKLGEELRKTADSAEEVGKAGGRAENGGNLFQKLFENLGLGANRAKEAKDEFKKLTSEAEVLTTAFKQVVAVFAAFAAVKGVKDIADTAARAETLGVTLGIVARNAGISKEQIGDYENKVRALGITTEATRDALTKMIQSGLQLGPAAGQSVSQVERLARSAQDLAVVTGENSSATLQRLITNISQLDTVGLRFQGIVVNREAAEAKFAATLGKTADQLTQQQKIQAFANATLDEAAKLTGAYEASLDTVGKKVQSLARYQTEAAKSIGDLLLPAYGSLVDSATSALKGLDQVAQGIGKNTSVASELGKVFDAVFKPLERLFVEIAKAVGDLTPAFVAVAGVAGEFAGAIFDTIAALVKGATDIGLFKVILEAIGLTLAAIVDGFTVLSIAASGIGLVFLRLAQYAVEANARLAEFFGQSEAAARSRSAAAAIEEQANRTQKAIEDQLQSFANGGSAIERYAKRLEDASKVAVKATTDQESAFKKFDDQITSLVGKVNQQQLNGREAAAAIEDLGRKVKDAGNAHDLSAKQVAQLEARLGSLALTAKDAAGQAFTELGAKIVNIGGVQFAEPINKQFGTVTQALGTLAGNVTVTDTQFRQAFTRGLDTTKSVADILALKGILDDAKKSGRDTSDVLQETARAFDKTFNQDLKNAKSAKELEDLRLKVVEITKQFPELGAVAQQALDKIAEKSKTAGVGLVEASKQLLDAAKGQADVLRAQNDVAKANLEVARARLGVDQAQLAFNKEGTELNRLKLEQAKQELAVAEAQKKEAELKFQVSKAELDLLIAKTRELNAERANAPQEVINKLRAEVEQREVTLNQTKTQVQQQEQVVIKLQEGVIAIKSQVTEQERLNVVVGQNIASLSNQNAQQQRNAEIAADQQRRLEASKQTYISLVPTIDSVTQQLQQAGVAAGDIAGKAREVVAEWQRVRGGAGTTWNQVWEGIDRANRKTQEVIENTKRAEQEAAAIQKRFEQAGSNIQNAALGIGTMRAGMASTDSAAARVADAMRQVREQAAQTARSALDAARGFAGSVRSIQIELAQAQGDDLEASRLRFAQRKQELSLQYEMLKVEIQIAIAKAQAAGVNTGALEKALASASTGYNEALRNLDKLAKIEQDQIRARKAEEARKKLEQQNDLQAADTLNQAKKEFNDLTKQASDTAASAVGAAAQGVGSAIQGVQSIAAVGGIVTPPSGNPNATNDSFGRRNVVGVYQLDLTMGDKTVKAEVSADQGTELLTTLNRARRRS